MRPIGVLSVTEGLREVADAVREQQRRIDELEAELALAYFGRTRPRSDSLYNVLVKSTQANAPEKIETFLNKENELYISLLNTARSEGLTPPRMSTVRILPSLVKRLSTRVAQAR